MRSTVLAAIFVVALSSAAAGARAAGPIVLERSPSELTVRLTESRQDQLYRVVYDDGEHRFVWENLSPDSSGLVCLRDDKHLRPEHRLRCESQTHPSDPVIFDDVLKGPVVAKSKRPFGVPVSTFGGAGYLAPGLSDLRRDEFGNFWLHLDHQPYAIFKYSPTLEYRYALLLPGAPVAHDVDGDGNLYILHAGNWISKHGPLGENLGAWELPRGREPGEFVEASGMAIDRDSGWIYLADARLGRVQRFDLDLNYQPLPVTLWGWIGRADLAYTRRGKYDEHLTYYQLDRPRQLVLDGRGYLFVSCEHWISKFDLATGRQLSFGRNPVLGWGGTFSDSAFSPSAALDGHWQRHWLAGVDPLGNVYVADRQNDFLINLRLQVFGSQGILIRSFDIEDEVKDASGEPVYLSAVRGLTFDEHSVYLVDAAGRIYRSPAGKGLCSGGQLFLGPGAAGRQFDLSRVAEGDFTVELQPSRVRHRFEGKLLGPRADGGTTNCELYGSAVVQDGHRSMWAPARIGEPFRVSLFDGDGRLIPADDYEIEYEQRPGLFGTRWDYFRVTNQSGQAWRNVAFVAESIE